MIVYNKCYNNSILDLLSIKMLWAHIFFIMEVQMSNWYTLSIKLERWFSDFSSCLVLFNCDI